MKKIGIGVLVIGVVLATSFFINSNKQDLTLYETVQLSKATIETKIVATGKVIPEDEVEIKPQIAGIIDKILVEEGDKVKAGDLLVKIKVVPNEQTLNSAEGRVKNSRIKRYPSSRFSKRTWGFRYYSCINGWWDSNDDALSNSNKLILLIFR